MRTLQVWSLFICLTAVFLNAAFGKASDGPPPGPNEILIARELVRQLEPCALYDFTLPYNLTRNLTSSLLTPTSIDQVLQLSKEFNSPNRWSKLYYPRPSTYRNQTSKSFLFLARLMKGFNISQINLFLLAPLIDTELNHLKKEGVIGECYVIETMENFVIPAKRTIAVSQSVQDKIDGLFTAPSSLPLSQNESDLVSKKILSPGEILELRAIRKASELFESNTLLKNDLAGGFWSNLYGEAFGGFQQLCTNEAETYFDFFRVLRSRNLVKHFVSQGIVSMYPPFLRDISKGGHAAFAIRSIASGEVFVIDGWFEAGGTAAHIFQEKDWRNLPIVSFEKKTFRDVVELLPN